MAGRYEAVREPRFEIEQGLGGERIRVKARRNAFALAFLPLWLLAWTVGGIAAIGELLETGELFLALWLCFWAMFEVGALLALAWMIAGAELIGVTGGDLEVAQSLFGWKRSRLYRGSEVRNLSASEAPPIFARMQISLPFVMKTKWGAVKFGYGGRTIYFAQGLDEAEGRMIVGRLLRALPAKAGG